MKVNKYSIERFKENRVGYVITLFLALAFLFLLSTNIASMGLYHQAIEEQGVISEPEPDPDLNTVILVQSSHRENKADPNDFDNDGLTNEEELLYRTDPRVADSDYDFLLDGEEVHIFHTNPKAVDSDYDYICDSLELFETKTNPISADSDNDGIMDGYELYVHGSNPLKPDTDGDSLSDYEEGYIYHTSMIKKDTDGDGLSDGDEILYYLTDPSNVDTDGDGLSDLWEISNKHDPLTPDNWKGFPSLFITVPAIGFVLLIGGIVASVRTQSFQRQTFQTEYEKKIKSEDDKKFLFDLLSSLPPNQELNIQEVAYKLGCSQESLNDLLQNLFEDSNEDYKSDFAFDNCVIQVHGDSKTHSYTCFYCKTSYNPLDGVCPSCLEEIVRCKLCNKPIAHQDNYTTCASCGVIGRENDITGFLNVDHICETCMFTKKYNVV